MSLRDPRPLDDEILARQGWLRRLARELVHDEAAVEDLVQDAWVASLTRPPDRPGALGAWLRAVLTNRARGRAEIDARRREREAIAARPEELAGPDEIAERLDLARRVAAALGELPEAERRALYLRYYEGQSPPAIARALGVPLGTVKSRLARGRELLRRRLDGEHGGERAVWVGLLLPLAALPAPVVPIEPSSAAALSAPAALKAILMGTQIKVAALVGVALVASLAVWRPWDRPSPGAVPAATAPAALASVEPESVEEARPVHSSELSSRTAISAAPEALEQVTPTTGGLHVSAHFESDAAPAAGAIGHISRSVYDNRGIGFVLDEQGRAEIAELEPGDWRLWLHGYGDGAWKVSVDSGANTPLEISIPPGLNLKGRVSGPDGEAVAGAEVFLAYDGDQPGVAVVTRSDAGGRFFLRDLTAWDDSGPFTALAARADGYVVSPRWDARGLPGDQLKIVLRLTQHAGRVRGRVIDEQGLPVEAASVRFEQPSEFIRMRGTVDGFLVEPPPLLRLTTDAAGAFESDRVAAGTRWLRVDSENHPRRGLKLDVELGRTCEVEIVLDTGGVLEGTVRDAQGIPVQKARVWSATPERDWSRNVETDAEGRYRLQGLPRGTLEFRAAVGFGIATTAQFKIASGETKVWDAVLAKPITCSGSLVDESGNPLEGWMVNVIDPARDGMWHSSTRADAQGRFLLDNCPAGDKALEVRMPSMFAAPPMLIVPFPDDGEIDLVVPDAVRPSARISGLATDTSGAPIEGLEIRLTSRDFNWGESAQPDRATLRFDFGPLSPGAHVLWTRAPYCIDRRIEIDLLAGESLELGSLEVERGGVLDLELIRTTPDPIPSYFLVHLVPRSGGPGQVSFANGETFLSEVLAPGKYALRIGGSNLGFIESEVDIVAGETTHARLSVAPGTYRNLSLEPFLENETYTLELMDADGNPCLIPIPHFGGSQASIVGLTVGRWRVRVTSSTGRKGEAEFEVTTLEELREPVRVLMR